MKTVTVEIVREFLDYDPYRGTLVWKPRDRKWFKSDRDCNAWNTLYSEEHFGTPSGDRSCIVGDVLGESYLAHRLIWLWMTGAWPDNQIDHINRNPSDNRWHNLRDVNASGNRRNQTKRKVRHSNTGITGINIKDGKYRAYILTKHLGTFSNLQDAISARKAAEKEYNFSEGHGT
jgi:hypothetical protein